MNFRGKSAFWFTDWLFSCFFKAPVPFGCTFTIVLSMQTDSILILIIFSICSASNTLCNTPFLLHLFILTYIVCQFPYSFGNALHLQPFSAMYKISFISCKLCILTLPLCTGRYFSIFLYCSIVISIELLFHIAMLVSIVWTDSNQIYKILFRN